MLAAAIAAVMIPTSLFAAMNVISNAAEGDYINIQNYIAQKVDTNLTGDVEKTDEFVESNPIAKIATLAMNGGDTEAIATNNEQLVDSGKYIEIKYTICNQEALADGFSFADVDDEDELLGVMVGQTMGQATLYDTEGDYYIGFVSPSAMNQSNDVYEYFIAYLSDQAKMIDGGYYDSDAGIVYVPKAAFQDGLDGDDPGVQIQLVVGYDFGDGTRKSPIDVTVSNENGYDAIKDINVVNVNNFDAEISIPLVKDGHEDEFVSSDFTVELNEDSKELSPDVDYMYDRESGTLYVSGSPTSVLSVKVDVNASTKEISSSEDDENAFEVSPYYAIGDSQNRLAGSWKAVPNVTLNLDWDKISGEIGVPIKYTGQANYASIVAPNGLLNADEIRAGNWIAKYAYTADNTERNGNLYGWIHNTGTLDNVYEDPNIGGGHVWNPPYSTSSSSMYYYMAFLMSLPMNHNNATWGPIGHALVESNPDTYRNTSNGSLMYPLVMGACSHVSGQAAVDPTDPQEGMGFYTSNANLTLTPMALELEGSNPYVVVGICCGTIRNQAGQSCGQAGAAMYKFSIKVEPPEKKGGLKLQKESTTGETNCFAGARYNIYDEDGNIQGTITTDANGYGDYWGLEADKYYWVHETTAPDGFEIDYTHGEDAPDWYESKNFTWAKEGDKGWYHPYVSECAEGDTAKYNVVGLNGAKTVKEDKIEEGPPYLQKYDKSSGSVLRQSGFVFDIYRESDDTVVMNDATTDSDGRIDLDELPNGDYYAKEVKVPSGSDYVADTTTKAEFSITDSSENEVVKFYNEKETIIEKPNLVVRKIDATTGQTAKQSGFKFRVTGPDGFSTTVTTGNDGIADVGEVEPGTYTATEIAVPTTGNWILNSTPSSEVVNEGETGTIEITVRNDRQQFGGIRVKKVSENGDMTNGNSYYDLSGAEFGIYDNSSCTGTPVQTLITGSDGTAQTGPEDFEEGDRYWVKEITPPKGFTLNTTIYPVTIVAGTYQPAGGSSGIANVPRHGTPPALQKIDSEKETNEAQGDASLAGAEFTWTYTGGGKTVTWVTVTDENGYTTLDDAHLKAGSPALWKIDGEVVLPIGELTVRETKTPEGYDINGDEHRWEINDTGSTTDPLIELTGDELEPDVPEDVVKGGLSIKKVDDDTGVYESQGDSDITEVRFKLVNKSKQSVMVNGTEYAPNAEITAYSPITLGADGTFTIPNGTLPYGTYEISEVTVPTGYNPNPTVYTIPIREAKVYGPDEYTFRNKIIRGKIEMPKVDTELSTYDGEETKTGNPQGDATVVGAEFTIKNVSKNPVLVDGPDGKRLYAVGEDCLVITTGSDGWARSAEDALPYGTYELRETKAPEGYNGTDEVWRFTIRTEDQLASPANVEERIDNVPIRGGVRMPKVDAALVRQPGYETVEGQATGDATLDGAEFEIYNISKSHVRVGGVLYEPGERIMTIPDANRTDKYYDTIITVGGIAKTTDDALPYGTYEMKEAKAPEGYEKSSETYTFSIETEGQMCGPDADDVEDKFDDVPSSWQPGGDKRDKELSKLSEEDTSDDATASAEATDEIETVTTDGVTITDPSVSINDIGLDKNPMTNAQGDATLEGAEFYLMNRSKNMVVVGGEVYQPDERILTIPQPDGGYDDVVTSDATGTIAFGEEGLPYGTYELGEETAPRGYNLSDDTYIIELHGKSSGKAISSEEALASGKATNDEVIGSSKADDAIDDTPIHGGLSVQKVDKETGRGDTIVTNEGENVDDIDYAANVPADAVDGESGDDTASDDESSENEDTDVSDVDVKTAAKSDDDTGNDGSDDNSGDSVALGDDVSEGSGSASDTDVDLNAFHRATLAGTMFEIRNASDKAVIVDGKLYQVGQVVKTITTNAQGYAATEPTALPFGTYDVYEVGAPNGYISSADSYGNADGVDDDREKTYIQTVEIREQGVIVPCARPFANQIKRGDITFQKIDDDGNVMPHVAFRVTSKTTGESHIIVTDENGIFNSSSSVIPHSQNTNANDDAFDADGNVDDDALVHDAGTWFYGKADGKAFYTDEQYTLPNYNDRFGASYVDDSVNADADNDATDGNVDGTTDGADNVNDTTTDTDDATNENDGALVLGDDVEGGSGSMGSGSGTPAIVNPVYTVTDDEGASIDVTIGYVATDENGSFENNSVVFNADGSITIVYDKTIVDMNTGERRSSTNYETYAEGNWSVKVAATNGLPESEDGYVDADGDGEYDIVDNKYAYTDKWQFPMSVVDDNLGAFPYDEYVFEELPSDATYGHNLVVFEATIERHNYLLNLGPITDNIIDIYTTATDQSDGDHILTTDEKVTIVDTVEYTNLNTDREYTMTGTLMDYETGEPMLDGNGNPITSSVTFKPESPNGSIDVVFELDASQLGGVQTVVFEDLYWNNIHIASHADIEDKNQLVEFHPEIGTVAVGDQTNDHFVYDDGSVIIVDTVHYKGVVPGREFIVHGILMDKNTGDALVDANGNTVENSVVFTPDTSEGDIEVLFEFDATNLAGLDVVVFENLYRIDTVTNRQPDDNGDENQAPVGDVPTKQRLVATHADINDESQTVNVRASGLASDQIMTPLVQTGAMVGAGLLCVAAIGGAVTYVVKRKRNGR